LPGDHVAGECPHPKGDRQSLRFGFLAEHISHRVIHDLNVVMMADHGRLSSNAKEFRTTLLSS